MGIILWKVRKSSGYDQGKMETLVVKSTDQQEVIIGDWWDFGLFNFYNPCILTALFFNVSKK